jgi:hypothetical protein
VQAAAGAFSKEKLSRVGWRFDQDELVVLNPAGGAIAGHDGSL